jgi:assimilatory nitrate reductase catalytic subunit
LHPGQQITGVRGDPEHPANFGRLCTKGSTLHLTASRRSRAKPACCNPCSASSAGPPQAGGWDSALDTGSAAFCPGHPQHGPDAVGFYVSGQLLTEDYYVFNKLAKGLIGTNNVDTNSRLCMSSAVAGYKQTLGADAPPACYDDVKHAASACSSPAPTPPMRTRSCFAALKTPARPTRALKIVVVDPRRTDTAAFADLHLPILPGTDVMLFNGMLHIMLWEGWLDQAFMAPTPAALTLSRPRCVTAHPDVVAARCAASARQT